MRRFLTCSGATIRPWRASRQARHALSQLRNLRTGLRCRVAHQLARRRHS